MMMTGGRRQGPGVAEPAPGPAAGATPERLPCAAPLALLHAAERAALRLGCRDSIDREGADREDVDPEEWEGQEGGGGGSEEEDE